MMRDELARIVKAASFIVDDNDVVVIGSQSILGSFSEADLPAITTVSVEADIAFWNDENSNKSDRVDGVLGEGSDFDRKFGYYGQGVSISTAILPSGWESRKVRYASEATGDAVAWCLEPHDLALSKLAAQREKDYSFVDALVMEGFIQIGILRARLSEMPPNGILNRRISNWIDACEKRKASFSSR